MTSRSSKAQRKNTNATTVVRQKRKARNIAKKAATSLETEGKSWTTGIMSRLKGFGVSDEDHAKKRLRRAKRGQKQLMKAGRLRKAAARIK